MVDEMELKDLLKWLFQFHSRMPLLLLLLIFTSLASPCSADKETSPAAASKASAGANRYGIAALNVLSSGLEYLDSTLTDNAGAETARTFGRPIKRLQSMLLPVMFKLGVLSTIIFMTFLLALKAVIIGSILLTLQVFGAIGKLGLLLKLKGGDHDHHYHQPPPIQYWAAPSYPETGGHHSKEVHLHVHTNSSPLQHSSHEYSPPSHSEPITQPITKQQAYGVPHETWSRSDISLDHPIPPAQVSWDSSLGHYVFKNGDTPRPVYYSVG